MDVFINDVSAILPNSPVTNDTIEDVLGKVRGVSSKAIKSPSDIMPWTLNRVD
jgi:hypothetical protein